MGEIEFFLMVIKSPTQVPMLRDRTGTVVFNIVLLLPTMSSTLSVSTFIKNQSSVIESMEQIEVFVVVKEIRDSFE